MPTGGPKLTSTGKLEDPFQERILSLSCMLIPEQIPMTGALKLAIQVGHSSWPNLAPMTVLENKRKESAPSAPRELSRLTRKLRESKGRQSPMCTMDDRETRHIHNRAQGKSFKKCYEALFN